MLLVSDSCFFVTGGGLYECPTQDIRVSTFPLIPFSVSDHSGGATVSVGGVATETSKQHLKHVLAASRVPAWVSLDVRYRGPGKVSDSGLAVCFFRHHLCLCKQTLFS